MTEHDHVHLGLPAEVAERMTEGVVYTCRLVDGDEQCIDFDSGQPEQGEERSDV